MSTTARSELLSAYDQGRKAGTEGASIIECPFDPSVNPLLTRGWLRGHRDTAVVGDIPSAAETEAKDKAMFPEDYTAAVPDSTVPDRAPAAVAAG